MKRNEVNSGKGKKRINEKAVKGKKEQEHLLHPPPLENVFTPLNTCRVVFALMSSPAQPVRRGISAARTERAGRGGEMVKC
jgi:hypothetical protein